MNKGLWTIVAGAGLAISGCGGDHSFSISSTPPTGAPPTDFADFVNQQVQTQPAFISATPAATSSLTTDLGLDNAKAFSGVTFGSGDALPAGTNQGSVACTQAGQAKCNPAVSVDLNSDLN